MLYIPFGMDTKGTDLEKGRVLKDGTVRFKSLEHAKECGVTQPYITYLAKNYAEYKTRYSEGTKARRVILNAS